MNDYQKQLLSTLLAEILSARYLELMEAQESALFTLIESLSPDPSISDYIFYPTEHGLSDPPTLSEIIQKIEAYKPIQL